MKPIPDADAKRRAQEVFALSVFIAGKPGATAAEAHEGAEKISATCRTSIFYYLQESIENGWIKMTGKSRATRYFATPEFQHSLTVQLLTHPVQRREKKGYNEDFMGSYVPNETFYLSDKQRQSLSQRCPVGAFKAEEKNIAIQVKRFMTDLSHNSSAFEGVSVKLADTVAFLEHNIECRSMSPIEAVILRNHYNAIRFIVENIHHPNRAEDIQVSEYDTRNIHAFLSDGLLKDRARQGRLRHTHVEIGNSAYIPLNIGGAISQEFSKMITKAAQIEDPFEQSFFLFTHIPYLQPFDDCNKRTSRLVCNIPLLRSGILPISWAEVNQRDYIDSLLCVYEHNSVFGLADIYTEAFHRSFERFDISLKQHEPKRLEITHARQITEAIRCRVLYGDITLPEGIDPSQAVEFHAVVESYLDGIRQNDMVGSPHRLKPADIQRWLECEAVEEKENASESPSEI